MFKPALKNCAVVLLLLPVFSAFGQHAGGNVNGWFDVGEFLYNNSNLSPDDNDFHILQYDSGCYWLDNFGDTQSLSMFAAGHVFDVAHELWSKVPGTSGFPVRSLAPGDAFVWDSLRFNYFYLRGNLDTSVTDTLFIYYYCNFNTPDTQIATYTFIRGLTDTIKLGSPLPFNYSELSGKYFRKDTLLLKHDDTSGIKAHRLYKTIVNRAFNGSSQTENHHSNLFGYSLAFKPGSVNTLGDILFDRRDSSAKANVFGVYLTKYDYNGWAPPMVSKLYAENSLWLSKPFRYGATYNGRAGFIPGWLFFATLSLHGAAFITATSTVSAKEINSDSVKLYPNPALPGEIITIETGEELPAQATITITDLLGRQVFSGIFENNHTFPAPITEGIYNVVITAGGSSSYSTKLIVINR